MTDTSLQDAERTYLQRAATLWAELRDADVPGVSLEDAPVLLEPVERQPSRPPTDLTGDHPERTDLPREAAATLRQEKSPVPLGKALQDAPLMVMLGEPGAGKTTTLQFIGLCFARREEGWPRERLRFDEDRVPVRLDLRVLAEGIEQGRWQAPMLLHALAHEVASLLQDLHPPNVDPYDLVKHWRDQGRLLALLDGLDEVTYRRDEVIEEIRRFALAARDTHTRVVVTSRPAGYAPLGEPFREYTLKPFRSVEEALPFLKHWLTALKKHEWSEEVVAEKAQTLLNELKEQPALRNFLTNPLILRLAAMTFAENEVVASSRATLYEAYIEDAWKRARRRNADPAWKQPAMAGLEALAWHFHTGGRHTRGEVVNTLARAQNVTDGETMLALLRKKMGLVVRVGDLYAFSHTTVQEYLVARRLARAWRENREGCWDFLRPRLHLPAWREPLLLLAGSLDAEDAGDLVRHVLEARSSHERVLLRDLALAAEMVREAPHVPEGVIALVVRRAESIAAPRGLCRLCTYWPCPARWRLTYRLRKRAVDILTRLGSPAVPPLIRALQDEDGWVRREAAQALGEIKDARAVPPLIRALQDEDEGVREAAAEALGKIGDAQAVPTLIQALQDKNEEVRKAAAEALGKIGDAQAVPTLIRTLKLKNKSWGVRKAAAEALGKIGAPAVPFLIRALQDEDEDVRRAAAQALGAIGDARAVPSLTQTLQDGDWSVREAAAWALGEIKDAQAVPPLIRTLQDENEEVRKAAAWALGEIKDARAIPPLVQALQDEDIFVRWAAAWALRMIGAPAVPFLIRTLQDEERRVHQAAAEALREIKDDRAVPPLIRALQDDRWWVRQAAAEALGMIGAPAVPPLIHALQDENWGVRQAAAEALGMIGDVQAVPTLIHALQDDSWKVREAAAWALQRMLPEPDDLVRENPEKQNPWSQYLREIVERSRRWAPENGSMAALLAAAQVRLEALAARDASKDPFQPPPPTRGQRAKQALKKHVTPLRVGLGIILSLVASYLTNLLPQIKSFNRWLVEQWTSLTARPYGFPLAVGLLILLLFLAYLLGTLVLWLRHEQKSR